MPMAKHSVANVAYVAQVQDAVAAELARSAEKRAMGPVDRDPVPRRFEEAVKRYYDALGGGR